MSHTKRIPQDQLTEYFDSFSRRFLMGGSPEAADIELIGPGDIGDQHIASGARLLGIDYDHHTAALEIQLDSGDRRVYDSREVWVIEEPDGFLSSMEVVMGDGTRQIVTIKRVGLRRVSRPT
jgi:hypothetical protein